MLLNTIMYKKREDYSSPDCVNIAAPTKVLMRIAPIAKSAIVFYVVGL